MLRRKHHLPIAPSPETVSEMRRNRANMVEGGEPSRARNVFAWGRHSASGMEVVRTRIRFSPVEYDDDEQRRMSVALACALGWRSFDIGGCRGVGTER